MGSQMLSSREERPPCTWMLPGNLGNLGFPRNKQEGGSPFRGSLGTFPGTFW